MSSLRSIANTAAILRGAAFETAVQTRDAPGQKCCHLAKGTTIHTETANGTVETELVEDLLELPSFPSPAGVRVLDHTRSVVFPTPNKYVISCSKEYIANGHFVLILEAQVWLSIQVSFRITERWRSMATPSSAQ